MKTLIEAVKSLSTHPKANADFVRREEVIRLIREHDPTAAIVTVLDDLLRVEKLEFHKLLLGTYIPGRSEARRAAKEVRDSLKSEEVKL